MLASIHKMVNAKTKSLFTSTIGDVVERIKYLWVFQQSSCIPYLNLNICNHPQHSVSVIEAFLMRLQSVMTQQHLSPWANVSCWKLIKQIWFWQPWTYFQQTWKIMANWPFVISAFLELKYSSRRRNLPQNVYIPGGGPSLVSVRLIIIGTFVAKLRAAWSGCGHTDYLYNILKFSEMGIPGR